MPLPCGSIANFKIFKYLKLIYTAANRCLFFFEERIGRQNPGFGESNEPNGSPPPAPQPETRRACPIQKKLTTTYLVGTSRGSKLIQQLPVGWPAGANISRTAPRNGLEAEERRIDRLARVAERSAAPERSPCTAATLDSLHRSFGGRPRAGARRATDTPNGRRRILAEESAT